MRPHFLSMNLYDNRREISSKDIQLCLIVSFQVSITGLTNYVNFQKNDETLSFGEWAWPS